ncbi:MAG TPA: protein kinase, partial [Anaerolineales bacterium]|nr:protein kinase [Anaerolineales bacterium]
MPFAVGETIGPYRIMDQLGQGGMATVFKAYHPALDRFVAIKAMHPVFMEDPSFLARFQREAQVVARLDHPNIVPVYDYSEHERRPYLVMRYIPGETLKGRLSRGRLSHAEVTLIVQAVADALAYAHSQGVLHRDIKPSNVLLSEGNRIYLADFGLARIAQAGQSTLSSDVMLGTPQYISPEQARGNTDLDEGTDIYSFGVMLYEIVTGQVPFNADTPYSIVHDHIYSALPPPRSFSPEVSTEVENVLLKALAKERRDRFVGVSDLGIAFLQAWESAQPVGRSGLQPMKNGAAVGDGNSPGDFVTVQGTDGSPASGAAPGGWGSGDQQYLRITSPEERPAGEGEATSLPLTAGDSQDRLASQVRERLQSGQSKPVRAAKRTRRRNRWWLLVPAVLAVCLCGFIGLAAIQGMAEAGEVEQSGQTATAPGTPSAQAFMDRSTGSGEGRTAVEGAPDGSLPPETPLETAQKHLTENPGDPAAYMNLALAYFAAGNYGAGHTALDDGASVAGEA